MNPALQPMSREAFIADITRDVPETPVYFLHSRDMNQAGPPPRDPDQLPPPLPAARCAEAMALGAVLIDTRPAAHFAALHASGSLNIGLDGQFASWVGTLVEPGEKIVLVCEPGREQEAVMRLARVGYENVAGILEGGVEAWASAGLRVASTALEPVTQAVRSGRNILDVRRPAEWSGFHVNGAVNIPLAQLVDKATGLDRNATYTIVCAGGYRSAIAASVLERMGFASVVATSGGMDAYRAAGLPAEPRS